MVDTPHAILPGPGTYFFTVRLRGPDADLLTRHIDLLRLSVRLCQFRHPFVIGDAVVLPDRVHTIWTLPPRDHDAAVRWRVIKSTFAQHLPAEATVGRRGSIWQRGIWEHPVLTLAELAECRDLIRLAPVQAGLVNDPRDWPYSTVNRAARAGRGGSNVVPLRLVR